MSSSMSSSRKFLSIVKDTLWTIGSNIRARSEYLSRRRFTVAWWWGRWWCICTTGMSELVWWRVALFCFPRTTALVTDRILFVSSHFRSSKKPKSMRFVSRTSAEISKYEFLFSASTQTITDSYDDQEPTQPMKIWNGNSNHANRKRSSAMP